jgi:hypothetical protein
VLHYAKRLAPWLFYFLHGIGRSKILRRKLANLAKAGNGAQQDHPSREREPAKRAA